jgi:hypothetical protein
MLTTVIVLGAAVLNLYSGVLYAADTLKGRARPNRVTWGLWSLAPMLGFAAQINKGVGIQAAMTLSVALGPLFVLAASFISKHAQWKITRFDIICGTMALLGLMLWIATGEGLFALVLSIIADLFAGLPTVVKAWNHPETESPLPFGLAAIAALLTLATIRNWQFETYSFSLYILLMNITIGTLATRKVRA